MWRVSDSDTVVLLLLLLKFGFSKIVGGTVDGGWGRAQAELPVVPSHSMKIPLSLDRVAASDKVAPSETVEPSNILGESSGLALWLLLLL